MRATLVVTMLSVVSLAGCFHGTDAPPDLPREAGCPKVNGNLTKTPLWKVETSMGTFVAELCYEHVPATVDHFRNLTLQQKFNAATFYRVVGPSEQSPNGFVIQGGLQQGAAQIPKAPEEFHPLLRHDRAGVLSIAHAGPGTGSSEFFVTLDATAHLDDRHTVFGYVVSGLDVVRAIGGVEVDASDKPKTAVTITNVLWGRDLREAPAIAPKLAAYAPLATVHGIPNEGTEWAVVVRNHGNAIDNVTVTIAGPDGFAVSAEPGRQTQPIPAGTARVFLVSALAPAGTNGTFPFTAKATSARSGDATATVPLSLVVGPGGPKVDRNWRIEANYVGMLPDGRIFDTSIESVAKNGTMWKFATQGGFTYRGDGAYRAFNFTPSGGVINGFANLATGAHIGETAFGRIPTALAYAWRPPKPDVYERPLIGKDLIFGLDILKRCATTVQAEAC